jgi:hypothetical protein
MRYILLLLAVVGLAFAPAPFPKPNQRAAPQMIVGVWEAARRRVELAKADVALWQERVAWSERLAKKCGGSAQLKAAQTHLEAAKAVLEKAQRDLEKAVGGAFK